jgi:hypothetical protein
MCRAYGFRNIQNVLRSIKRRQCKYDLIELLACPGGCTNGGGMLLFLYCFGSSDLLFDLYQLFSCCSLSYGLGQIKATMTENSKVLLEKVNDAYNSQSLAIQNPIMNPFVNGMFHSLTFSQLG